MHYATVLKAVQVACKANKNKKCVVAEVLAAVPYEHKENIGSKLESVYQKEPRLATKVKKENGLKGNYWKMTKAGEKYVKDNASSIETICPPKDAARYAGTSSKVQKAKAGMSTEEMMFASAGASLMNKSKEKTIFIKQARAKMAAFFVKMDGDFEVMLNQIEGITDDEQSV